MQRTKCFMILLAITALAAAAVPAAAQTGPVANQDGEVETLDGVAFTHHFAEVNGLTWHYVEAGAGEAVVFLHGTPSSWYVWHYQMSGLADSYHSIAIDLKGFGQSDKADGDYSAANVAEELLALLDAIGIDQFNLVAQNSPQVGEAIAANHPDRVLRYVRFGAMGRGMGGFGGGFGGEGGQPPAGGEGGEPPAAPGNEPPADADAPREQFTEEARAQMLEQMQQSMADPTTYVRDTISRQIVQPIVAADIDRIVAEFSYEGTAEAVARYTRDTMLAMSPAAEGGGEEAEGDGAGMPPGQRNFMDFSAMTMPVLLLQGDFGQEVAADQLDALAQNFPNVTVQTIEAAGGYPHLEQHAAVTDAIRAFLQTPLT